MTSPPKLELLRPLPRQFRIIYTCHPRRPGDPAFFRVVAGAYAPTAGERWGFLLQALVRSTMRLD